MMTAPRKLTPSKEARVAEDYKAGTPIRQITATHGVSAGTVRAIAKRAGLPLRPVGRPANPAH